MVYYILRMQRNLTSTINLWFVSRNYKEEGDRKKAGLVYLCIGAV
jgi:hypothetical protein